MAARRAPAQAAGRGASAKKGRPAARREPTGKPGKASPPRAPREGKDPRAQTVNVEGRQLRLSNLDKVMYPETGFTKGQVLDYYVRVAPALLPHLEGRALSLKRYPHGVGEPFFFQKQSPSHRPKWLRTARIWSEGRNDWIDYCTASDLASLVWLVNLSDLELHPFLAKATDPLAPTMMVFDLDPGPGADLVLCSGVAIKLRERLLQDGLASYPKVSGGKGMQLYVPLNTKHTFDQTKGYSRRLAEELERAFPHNVTSNMRKELRKGKVFIDWSQNDDHKTTICVYSLRGQPRPWASVPLHWDEVEDCVQRRDAGHLRFAPEDALHRVEEEGDLFADVLVKKQRLP